MGLKFGTAAGCNGCVVGKGSDKRLLMRACVLCLPSKQQFGLGLVALLVEYQVEYLHVMNSLTTVSLYRARVNPGWSSDVQ
jgi:hypothetical protein